MYTVILIKFILVKHAMIKKILDGRAVGVLNYVVPIKYKKYQRELGNDFVLNNALERTWELP